MASSDAQRRRAALVMMVRAVVATKERTPEEAHACNGRFSRARDFLLFSETMPLASHGLGLTDGEVAAGREQALKDLRAICKTCGLCAALGLRPP